MTQLKSGITLQPGEQLVFELEAELYATSSNPLAQAMGKLRRVVDMILGHKISGWLVITDRRVIEVATETSCYVFNVGHTVKYVLPTSVKEIGYEKESTCCVFCPAIYLYYEGFTQTTKVLLPFGEETAQQVVDAFYNAISHKQL